MFNHSGAARRADVKQCMVGWPTSEKICILHVDMTGFTLTVRWTGTEQRTGERRADGAVPLNKGRQCRGHASTVCSCCVVKDCLGGRVGLVGSVVCE